MTRQYKKNLLSLFVITLMSCGIKISIPIKFNLDKIIAITEEYSEEFRDNIIKELRDIEFNEDTTKPSADECKAAFISWLENKFNDGKVPKKDITPLEYTGINYDDLFSCPTVPLQKAVEQALRKASEQGSTSNLNNLYSLGDEKEKLEKEKCLEPFLDPKEERVQILEIYTTSIKNNLTYPFPKINIYYSTHILDKSEYENDSEKNLLQSGKIKRLGFLPEIPAGFEGRIDGTLVQGKDLKAAQKTLSLLNSQIIFYAQQQMISEQTIDGLNYYLVPRGQFTSKVTVVFDIALKPSDGMCYAKQGLED